MPLDTLSRKEYLFYEILFKIDEIKKIRNIETVLNPMNNKMTKKYLNSGYDLDAAMSLSLLEILLLYKNIQSAEKI